LRQRIKVVSISERFSDDSVKETTDAMMRGELVIHSGSLFNDVDRTFGIADLIVRSDIINTLFDREIIPPTDVNIRAPKLPEGAHYHYVVLDIKWKTLEILTDGKTLSNMKRNLAYKGQVNIYNNAIACIQGYLPENAFIVGSAYKCRQVSVKGYRKSVATVSFNGKDSKVPSQVAGAVDWIRVVDANRDRWLDKDPIKCHPRLKPNMTINSGAYQYDKVAYAKKIKDITLVWQCGTKHRELAHRAGIYTYDDPRLTADIMGFKNSRKEIVNSILRINRDSVNELYHPPTVSGEMFGWTDRPNRFFVDFEAVPLSHKDVKLFMIGVHHENESGEWTFTSFIARKLNIEELHRIMSEFKTYVYENTYPSGSRPRLYHYGHYEQSTWRSHSALVNNYYDSMNPTIAKAIASSIEFLEGTWVDMLTVIRDEQVVVKGSLGFSIKDIGGALFKHGLIQSCWDSESSCLNGEDAVVLASEYYESVDNNELVDENIMTTIEWYNEMDVVVLRNIVEFLDGIVRVSV